MPNALIHETSPYLLQHAHNPVDWQPWGERSLQKAKDENKLIIVSIGYSACHWCHVMEHESFSDNDVARFMNKHFVCIKIDREERPDIDHVYMTAVQLITGSGGWPLNVITLPNTKPIYGGTYFPKKTWLTMLEQILEFVNLNPDKAQEQADSLTQHIQIDPTFTIASENQDFSLDDLLPILEIWLKRIDFHEGGYLRAPKFPLPSGFHFLLQSHSLTKPSPLSDMALSAVVITLDKMANGGIYDQIGGGFARYSTDSFWKVPHFEKMLYDNAQLVSLYANAFQLTQKPLYRTIIEETLAFIERELTDPHGGFYCALDADSEGEEGKFYVWTKDDFHQALGSDAPLFIEYFNVKEDGNWEHHKNILLKTRPDSYFLEKYHLSDSDFNARLSTFKTIMLNKRDLRTRPSLDDKILTSWNALALKAYIDASRALNRTDYLITAINHATFLLKNLKHDDDQLSRSFKHGEEAKINGFLDDYAFTIEAMIHLYQATFDFVWLQEAERLTVYVLKHFHDAQTGMFFYTSDLDAPLVAPSIEVTDNVLPSSNSVMAKNLFTLSMYFERDHYLETAKSMLRNVQDMAKKGAEYYGNWDTLWAWLASEPSMVAIVGKHCVEMRQRFDPYYLPNVLFLGETEPHQTLPLLKNRFVSNQTLIYVCKNKTCLLPTSDVNEAMKLLV